MRTPHGKSRWILLAAGLWLAASAVAWAAEHPAAGHWEGAIELPGTKLEVLVDLKAGGRGSLYGTVSIPKQNAKDLPLANVTAEGAKISFEIQGIPGTPTFSGEVKGDAFAGDFTQGGKSFPFSLERKDDPAAAARRAMEGFDPVVEDAMKRFDVPGLAIAVVKGKDVVYAKGFGFRDVEKQLPVTPDTLFAIGSSTKAFTAFVLGTLVDEGRVDWDTPVRTYIPWFKLYDPSASERITPRDLLTHRSGLPRHDLAWYNNNDITREEVVRRLAYLEPSADLREKFQYNNMMYLTAGYLAETLTGMTWEQAVRTRVLDPAGMTRTNFDVAVSERDADAAQPYAKKDDKVVKVPFRPIVAPGPAGSINSTADDMARWAIVHLNGGKIGDVRVANASTVEEMHIPRMTTGATPDEPEITPPDYALGWFVQTYRGHRRVQHGGNIDGFTAMVSLLPDDGVGVVCFANMDGTALPELLARTASDRLLGLPARDWIGEAAGRRQRGEALDREAKKKKASVKVPNTVPSHPLKDFAGDYEHPGYGLLKVALKDGKLSYLYNAIDTPLEHWHYDTFNGLKAKDDAYEDLKLTFQTDPRGYVASVSIPFEPAVKDIVFVRKPDAFLSDPAYLAKVAGTYKLLDTTLTVERKGTALVLHQPGAPLMDLVPALGGEYFIKQASIVTLKFLEDAAGKVTGIETHQPNGVFVIQRVEGKEAGK